MDKPIYMSVGPFYNECEFNNCDRLAKVVVYIDNSVFSKSCDIHSVHFQDTANKIISTGRNPND